MTWGLTWVITPETAWMANYERWANGIINGVEAVFQARRGEIESWMKANHPWKNRTGIAEAGLFADVVREGMFVSLVMGHDSLTYYSRFLERYMSMVRPGISKWSVLAPALDYWGPLLLSDLRKALS